MSTTNVSLSLVFHSAGVPKSTASNTFARSVTVWSRPAIVREDGEVDVIAWDGDVLVFVEVKALGPRRPPEDAVGCRKRKRIIRAPRPTCPARRLHEAPYRFDILAVTRRRGSKPEFRLLRDAFAMYN